MARATSFSRLGLNTKFEQSFGGKSRAGFLATTPVTCDGLSQMDGPSIVIQVL